MMEKHNTAEIQTKPTPTGFKRWMRKHIAAEVPSEVAACEFECSVHECSLQRWTNCERRLKWMAERNQKAC